MATSCEQVLSTIEDGVLVLQLCRPEKLNALTQEMYAALNQGLDDASRSDEIGAVLITAAGDHFSAGNDLKDFLSIAMESEAVNPSELPVIGFIQRLVEFEKPLLVAVQGQAVGIGLTLTLHADFVYLADTAVLSAPFVNLGLVPEAGSSLLLPQKVGSARASEILLAGKSVDAEKALSWGLANQVVSTDELFSTALVSSKELAKKPREAMRLSKQLMRGDKDALKSQIDKELEIFFGCLRSEEAKSAFSSFLAR